MLRPLRTDRWVILGSILGGFFRSSLLGGSPKVDLARICRSIILGAGLKFDRAGSSRGWAVHGSFWAVLGLFHPEMNQRRSEKVPGWPQDRLQKIPGQPRTSPGRPRTAPRQIRFGPWTAPRQPLRGPGESWGGHGPPRHSKRLLGGPKTPPRKPPRSIQDASKLV